MAQTGIDGITRPMCRTQSAIGGIDAGNAGDHDVALLEVDKTTVDES
jgi:hypothetical protein